MGGKHNCEKKCLWCGNKEFIEIAIRKDNERVVQCLSCNLKQLENIPNNLIKIYNKYDYFEKDVDCIDKIPNIGYIKYDEIPLSDFLWQYAFMKLMIKKSAGKTLLDIGCASGKFLELAEIDGFSVKGIDISRHAIQISKLKGLNVSLCSFDQYTINDKFDVITAWDVIEHVDHPKGFFEKCFQLLKSDGMLLFSTPDAGSKVAQEKGDDWIGYTSSLEHISFFDQEFLNRAVNEIFHVAPMLYSFNYGEYSTIIGCVKKGGISGQDLLIDQYIKNILYPDDVEKNADISLLLSILYIHFEQDLEQVQKILDMLELVVPKSKIVLIQSLLYIKQGRYNEAIELFRNMPISYYKKPIELNVLIDALWLEIKRLKSYIEEAKKIAAESTVEKQKLAEEKVQFIIEKERIAIDYLKKITESQKIIDEQLKYIAGLQSDITCLESKVKDKESLIIKLRDKLKHIEATSKKKDEEIDNLKEVIRMHESSVSWRLSQVYGKFLSYNSIPTRFFRMIIDKIIPLNKPSTSIQANVKNSNTITSVPNTIFNPYKRLKMIKPIKVTVIDKDYSDKLNEIKVKFSLIIPVKNEEKILKKLLKNIEHQTLKPDEIIFVDGGSTDTTLKILEEYQKTSGLPFNITIVKPEGGSLATHRNEGIKAARNDLLALTDAVAIPPNYCINLIGPIIEYPEVDLVGGIYYPTKKNYWNDKFIWQWESINYDDYIPSARSLLIKKRLALEIGGFPEFLNFTGEDTLFNLVYRKHSKEWIINKSAYVYWDVVDGDKDKALKKAFSYGKGDGENGIGDFRFYEMLAAKLKNGKISIDDPILEASFNGYLEGRKNRVTNLAKKNIVRGNILILSGVPFTDSGGGQRGTQLALELMKKGYKVTFCNVYPSFEQEKEVYLDIEYPLIELYSLADFSLDDYLERHINLLEKTFVILEFPHPDFLPIINKLKAMVPEVKIIYDCIDNWDSNLGWRWYTKEKEIEIATIADILIASSNTLVQKLKAIVGKEVLLLPNAVNTRLFDPSKKYNRPPDLPDNGRYIITYIGALWGEWFDWSLMKEIAQNINNANFVLIGNIPETNKDYLELKTFKNVFFLGLKNQFDLPAYLYYTDVCIIPFKYDEKIIKYTNPLKVYEYLAMNKPVVTTYMDELKGIPYVYLSKAHDEFISNLRDVLGKNVDFEIIKEFIYKNSWSNRVANLLKCLEN